MAGGGTALAWQRLRESVSETEPKHLVKFIVIGVCLILVYMQIVSCYYKLNNPDITTHTELKQNETMEFPALTFCREPPYDRTKYAKYKLGSTHTGSYPLMNQWEKFPFDQYTLDDFFNEAVYNETQVFDFYGLGEGQNLTKLVSRKFLTVGQCFTLYPQNPQKLVGKKNGLSVVVKHDLYDYKPLYDDEPGWNIYFHQKRESFSENQEILTGRQDHLFVRVNEEVEVNVEVMEFGLIKNCNDSYNYSSAECEELCWVQSIAKEVNCTGPWFPWLNFSQCNNYPDLTVLYRKTIQMSFLNCCLPHCNSKLFKASVVSRTDLAPNRFNMSRIYVYYTSKALLTMNENFAYDWNLFVADLGGSLGFLLGLSVLGIVSVLEQVVKIIWGGKEKKKSKTIDKSLEEYKWKLDSPFKMAPRVAAKIDRY